MRRRTTASCTRTASRTSTATCGKCSGWIPRLRHRTPEAARASASMHSSTHDAIAAVWRLEAAKVVATVARLVRDVAVAEELAQEALVAALERWPRDGLPDRPGAWLMATARNRALDHLRHQQMQARKHEELGRDLQAQEALIVPDFTDALDAARQDEIGDDLLRLMFTACHPLLP